MAMKKRLLSLLLVFVMVLGMMPGTAMAGDSSGWSSAKTNGMLVGNLADMPAFPTSADNAALIWSTCAGLYGSSGVGSNGEVTNPVFMDGYLYIIGGENGKQQLLKIDPDDGSILGRVNLHGQGGFYYFLSCGGDQIYFRGNGYVQAFDKELNSQWIYEDSDIGQSYAGSILYDDGRIYFGTAAQRTYGQAHFYCIDAADGSLVWKNLADLDWETYFKDTKYGNYWGHYWAGPCVIGNYVVYGSDGGRLYSANKTDGTIVQRLDVGADIYGEEGSDKYKSFIRSGVIYDGNGKIYFTSTDLYVHMADFDSETGEISNHKYAVIGEAPGPGGNVSGFSNDAATSTPVLHNGRLYAATAKAFAVFDADTLERIYYTAAENGTMRDLRLAADENGDAYIFTTYYKNPGSVVMFTDKAGQTEPSGYSDFAAVTSAHVQYNAASPIFGPDGTIYCTNDLGYLMAIQKPTAYLESMNPSVGTLSKEFAPSTLEYELVVPVGTRTLDLELTANEGSEIKVNDTPLEGDSLSIALDNSGTAAVTIVASQGAGKLTYRLNIREISTDNSMSVVTNTSNNINFGDPTVIEPYADAENTFVVTNASGSTRVWIGAADSHAVVSNFQLLSGAQRITDTTNNNSYNGITYPMRVFASSAYSYPMLASFDVTAENGDCETYYLLMTSEEEYNGTPAFLLGLELNKTELSLTLSDRAESETLTATYKYLGIVPEELPAITWSSSDNTVAVVDENGTVTATGSGITVITAGVNGISASCTVKVEKENGGGSESGGSGSGGGEAVTPKKITAYVSFSDDTGAFATGKNGRTVLWNVPVKVTDENGDGKYTVSEALLAFHEACHSGGKKGFAANSGGWISKFWSEETADLGIVLNDGWCAGGGAEIDADDRISVFFYQDTDDYSDLYLFFDSDSCTATTGAAKKFTVNGLNIFQSSEKGDALGAPGGASVTVYNSNGKSVLTTVTDKDGEFTLTFPSAGTYTVEVSGTADYKSKGSYGSGTFKNAPVVPARCTVKVPSDGGTDLEEKPQDTVLTFTDVKENAYYFKALIWAVEKGITTGTGDGTTFSPNASCTRAQMMTFLWRAAGSPEPAVTVNPFTDVKEDAYYLKALLWAVEKGITSGTGDGTTFSPNASCTRAQTMTFLYRYADSPAVNGKNPFADVKETDYFHAAVIWAAKEGISSGTSDTTFGGSNDCTRAQMMTFLYRLLNDDNSGSVK